MVCWWSIHKHECEESNPVRRFWRPLALPGAHSCISPWPVLMPAGVCWRGRLLFQRDVPVRLAHEPRPACDPHAFASVHRLPRWPLGQLAELHTRLPWQAIGLPLVAGDARQHAVLPGRLAAPRARHDVGDREFLAPVLGVAILE